MVRDATDATFYSSAFGVKLATTLLVTDMRSLGTAWDNQILASTDFPAS